MVGLPTLRLAKVLMVEFGIEPRFAFFPPTPAHAIKETFIAEMDNFEDSLASMLLTRPAEKQSIAHAIRMELRPHLIPLKFSIYLHRLLTCFFIRLKESELPFGYGAHTLLNFHLAPFRHCIVNFQNGVQYTYHTSIVAIRAVAIQPIRQP